MNDLPCLIRTLQSSSKPIKILVDSGTTFNYIKPNLQLGKRLKVSENRWAKTIHGYSKIQFKQQIRLLKHNLEFLELDGLTDFDMMLGSKSLEKMKARINFSEYKFTAQFTRKFRSTKFRYTTYKFYNRYSKILK